MVGKEAQYLSHISSCKILTKFLKFQISELDSLNKSLQVDSSRIEISSYRVEKHAVDSL